MLKKLLQIIGLTRSNFLVTRYYAHAVRRIGPPSLAFFNGHGDWLVV